MVVVMSHSVELIVKGADHCLHHGLHCYYYMLVVLLYMVMLDITLVR